jgi:hypothetical protein
MNDQPPNQPRTRPPACPDCMKPMRFVTSDPDKIHRILQHVMFMCDCGRASDQVIISSTP